MQRVAWIFAASIFVGAAIAAPEGTVTRYQKVLPAPPTGQPPIEVLHVMKTTSKEVVLDIQFPSGIHRKKGRGTTAGVYIEVNDADQATHPVRNPFAPIPVDRAANPDWKDFVARDFPYPNPQTGYWYTWGRQREPLKRPIRLRFGQAGRYRIRVRGVLPPDRHGPRVPTLMRVIEVGHGVKTPYLAPGWDRVERALPTGKRKTSQLLIHRDSPREVGIGAPFEYILRVKNIGLHRIPNVALVESGDNVITITRSSIRHEVENQGVYVWRLGALEPGATREVKVTARIDQAGTPERKLQARWTSRPLTQTTTVR